MIVCQSNFIPDIRSCTIKDEHQVTCDGLELRWSPDDQAEIPTGRACGGCAPRRAQVGFVCGSCHEMILAGVNAFPAWSRALIGVTRAVTPERGGGGHAIGYTPHTALQLDAGAIWSHYRTYPGHLETWLSSTAGAEHAIRFGIEMRGALHRHPTKEQPHTLHRTYCSECRQLTLVWHPPTYEGGRVVVKCRNPECGHEVRDGAIDDIAYIEDSVWRKRAKR